MIWLPAAVDPGTAGIALALVAGIGGTIATIIKIGPERTNVIVTYQARALNDLQSENRRLLRENGDLRERLTRVEKAHRDSEKLHAHDLERRIALLESGTHGTRSSDPT